MEEGAITRLWPSLLKVGPFIFENIFDWVLKKGSEKLICRPTFGHFLKSNGLKCYFCDLRFLEDNPTSQDK